MNDNQKLLVEVAKANPLYLFFSGNELFNDHNIGIEKTPWRETESDNSLTYKGACLKQIFDLDESFCEKHAQAIGGSGNEGRKIMTLHSSSLLSLLCFYKISEINKLKLDVIPGIEFSESEFEKKNKVSGDGFSFTSNIDVALYSRNKKVVCFLESKFSEYLSCGKKDGVSKDAYGKFYDKLLNNTELGKHLIYSESDQCLFSCEGGNHYCEGIKQMVSHYLGAVEYCVASEHQDEQVYLGEIMFKFGSSLIDKIIRGSKPKRNHFEDYTTLYECFVQAINSLDIEYKPSNLHLLKNVMTYQDVFNKVGFLDAKVKELYKL